MNTQPQSVQLEHLRGIVFQAATRGGKYGITLEIEEPSSVMREKWGRTYTLSGHSTTDGRNTGSFGYNNLSDQREWLIRDVVNSKYIDGHTYIASVDRLGVMAEASRHSSAVPLGKIISNLTLAESEATGQPALNPPMSAAYVPPLDFEAHSQDGSIFLQLVSTRRPDPNHPGSDKTIPVYEAREWENGVSVGSSVGVTLESSLVVDLLLEARHLLNKPFIVVSDRVGVVEAAELRTPAYLEENAENYRAAQHGRDLFPSSPDLEEEGERLAV